MTRLTHNSLGKTKEWLTIYIIKGDKSVYLLPMAGWTAGPIETKLGIRTHVDPGTVLVKVKVIYLCVRYNRIHACDTWRTTMNHAGISISSSSSAVSAATWWMLLKLLTEAPATWWMLIKLLTEARKGREHSSTKRDKSPSGGRVLTASINIVSFEILLLHW